MSKATEGLAKIIGRIVAEELQKRIPNDTFGLCTVTNTHVCRDFDFADIYVSAFFNREELTPFLRDNVYAIQQVVNKKVKRGKVPKIRFQSDFDGQFSHHLEDYLSGKEESL